MGRVEPYFLGRSDLMKAKVRAPRQSDPKRDPAGYKAQADEVLAVSAALTDEQKMAAEFFSNKIASFGGANSFADQKFGHDLDQFIFIRVINNIAGFDTLIPIWAEKRRHDAVRPFSAIRYLYGDEPVTAWGGPGVGVVDDITGNEWQSYLAVPDHPEYPSISTALCEANAEANRLYLGTDELGWTLPRAKGSSFVEPGTTPASDIELHFATWTEFAEICGESRLWGGLHFQAAIDVARPVGKRIGRIVYEFLKAHIEGTAPPPK
jgi:hypothetical protein